MSQDIYVLALTDPNVDSSDKDAVIQYCSDKAEELCLNEAVTRACVEYMHPFSPAMQQAQMLIDRWIARRIYQSKRWGTPLSRTLRRWSEERE